jgi:hypothetical protein
MNKILPFKHKKWVQDIQWVLVSSTNSKVKLSSNWFKYEDIKTLDNNREENSKLCNKMPPKLDAPSCASNGKF